MGVDVMNDQRRGYKHAPLPRHKQIQAADSHEIILPAKLKRIRAFAKTAELTFVASTEHTGLPRVSQKLKEFRSERPINRPTTKIVFTVEPPHRQQRLARLHRKIIARRQIVEIRHGLTSNS